MPRPAHRPPPAAGVATLVIVLGAGFLLAGCSSGSSAGSDRDTPAARSSSTATASARVTETPPEAPEARRGRAGQRAFARHVMAVWGYALRTDDVKPLVALGTGGHGCGGCPALGRELAHRRTQHWAVDFPGVDVRRITVTDRGEVHVARATVDIPASDSYLSDGSYRNTSPAHRGATFEVQMHLSHRRYQLVSFTVS